MYTGAVERKVEALLEAFAEVNRVVHVAANADVAHAAEVMEEAGLQEGR